MSELLTLPPAVELPDLSPTAKGVLLAGRKNKIINGGFDIWRRGLSFSEVDFPLGTGYSADRWFVSMINSGAYTISQQAFPLGQTDVPGEPEFYLRTQRTVVGAFSFREGPVQKIENVRTYAGSEVTLSFYARSDNISGLVGVTVTQIFGSGGSADVLVHQVQEAVTTTFTQYTYTFNVPSISSKTIGAGSYLNVGINYQGANLLYDFDISNVQIEPGNKATDFEKLFIGDILQQCQRYYRRYERGGNLNNAATLGTSFAENTTTMQSYLQFDSEMRSAPVVTFSSPTALLGRDPNVINRLSISVSGSSTKLVGELTMISAAASFTTGKSGYILLNTNSWVDFDAEI